MSEKSELRSPSLRRTNGLAFFLGFLRNPEQVGSVIPSSRYLENRIIQAAGLEHARVAVELGPGTGGTSRAFLRVMPEKSYLLNIELEQQFIPLLDEIGDRRLINHCGSARDIEEILLHYGLPEPDVVISGIPFSTMPQELGQAIIRAVWQSLAPGGRFVAYQFRGQVADIGSDLLGPPDVDMALFNAPPMRVYTWRKPVTANKL